MKIRIIIGLFALCSLVGCKENKTTNTEKTESAIQDTVAPHKVISDLHNVSENCIDAVFKIIESSENYRELTDGLEERIIKNGGTGFGFSVNVSPNPNVDQAIEKGDFYEISVHESYPDRMVNLEYYRFDRHQKKLFVMNIVEGEYEEIAFDHNLIAEFERACAE